MAASKILVVFDPETREPLRVVVPDDDAELPLHVAAGEAYILIDKPDYEINPANLQQFLATAVPSE